MSCQKRRSCAQLPRSRSARLAAEVRDLRAALDAQQEAWDAWREIQDRREAGDTFPLRQPLLTLHQGGAA